MITLANLIFILKQSTAFGADSRVAQETLREIANRPDMPRAVDGGYTRAQADYLLKQLPFPFEYLESNGLGGGVRKNLRDLFDAYWAEHGEGA